MIKVMLAAGLCFVFFMATTSSDDQCVDRTEKGSVVVMNRKDYMVEVWIGDNGPYTCENSAFDTKIFNVDPGNHVYCWFSVIKFMNGKKRFGAGTVLVEKGKTSYIAIPPD